MGETKKKSAILLDGFLDLIQDSLVIEDEVKFVGFGKFVAKVTPARIGRNPKNGREAAIPEKRVCKFRAGKELADKINI